MDTARVEDIAKRLYERTWFELISKTKSRALIWLMRRSYKTWENAPEKVRRDYRDRVMFVLNAYHYKED